MVTGNKWWGSLKYRIRDFAVKYGQQYKLDRTKMAKSLDDRLYRELVVGLASYPLAERFGWLLGKVHSQWNWAPVFLLTWWLSRNALPLVDWAFKAGLADMPDGLRCGSGFEETALHAFYYCEQVRTFWSHFGE